MFKKLITKIRWSIECKYPCSICRWKGLCYADLDGREVPEEVRDLLPADCMLEDE